MTRELQIWIPDVTDDGDDGWFNKYNFNRFFKSKNAITSLPNETIIVHYMFFITKLSLPGALHNN